MNNLRTRGIFYMWLTILFWGISFVATKVMVGIIPPFTAAIVRFALASLIMMLLIKRKSNYSKKEFIYMLLASFFGVSIYFVFENAALLYTTATNGSLIVSATPVFYLIFDDIVKRKFSGKIRYLGTLVAFIGVAILIFNGRFILKLNPLGDTLMFGAVAGWVLYTMFMEKLHNVDNIIVSRDLNLYGGFFLIPFVILEMFDPKNSIPVATWIKPDLVIAILYLGIFCSAIGYVLWNAAIKYAGTKTTTNGIFFIPVVTVIADSIILHNIPNIYTITGAALVIFGTYISELKSKNKEFTNAFKGE